MGNEWMPLFSAGIGGVVALIVIFINQIMTHIRWKEELKRKGEDKYIEKKLANLHDTIVGFFEDANKALELSRIVEDTRARYVKEEIDELDITVRKRIANASPYFDNSLKNRIENVYEILTGIRLIMRKEIEGDDKDIVTHLLWLNEELYFFNDDLEVVMKGYHVKKEVTVPKWIAIISVLINILLAIYIFSF
jgi:hypothetical protein